MSLILDALNRSRQESEPVPGIATEHAGIVMQRPALRRYLPWAALGVALLVIAWLLVARAPVPAPATQPATSGADAPSQVQDNAAAAVSDNLGSALMSVTAELQQRAVAASAAGEVAGRAAQSGAVTRADPGTSVSVGEAQQLLDPRSSGTDRSASAPRAAQAGVAAATPAAGVPAAPRQAPVDARGTSTRAAEASPVDPAVAAIYQAQAASIAEPAPVSAQPGGGGAVEPSANAQIREDPVDIERMLMRAREELKEARLVDHPAPFLSTLSQQTKDDIPTILYQRHDYSVQEGQSSVVLNGASLKVGGQTRGVEVQEILPESVILNFGGVVFRLRALNSWVNL